MNFLQRFVANLFNIPHMEEDQLADMMLTVASEQFKLGTEAAKVHWRVIPLPFTVEQLAGASYGEFITPAGFATQFGECNVPAPGPHGYEQRAYYIDRAELNGGAMDMVVHKGDKFADAANSDELVPVIVTVLR